MTSMAPNCVRCGQFRPCPAPVPGAGARRLGGCLWPLIPQTGTQGGCWRENRPVPPNRLPRFGGRGPIGPSELGLPALAGNRRPSRLGTPRRYQDGHGLGAGADADPSDRVSRRLDGLVAGGRDGGSHGRTYLTSTHADRQHQADLVNSSDRGEPARIASGQRSETPARARVLCA
jgi:hypothetical protein